MDKKPKDESTKKEDAAKPAINPPENCTDEESDESLRGYYYDDSHGYQKYIPEGDDDPGQE
ncbi:MAG: hypothetical protein KDB79_06465 [Acidobacteria bacterium]|nr:hypothetical protein [Acidobacteriota bacterium]